MKLLYPYSTHYIIIAVRPPVLEKLREGHVFLVLPLSVPWKVVEHRQQSLAPCVRGRSTFLELCQHVCRVSAHIFSSEMYSFKCLMAGARALRYFHKQLPILTAAWLAFGQWARTISRPTLYSLFSLIAFPSDATEVLDSGVPSFSATSPPRCCTIKRIWAFASSARWRKRWRRSRCARGEYLLMVSNCRVLVTSYDNDQRTVGE